VSGGEKKRVTSAGAHGNWHSQPHTRCLPQVERLRHAAFNAALLNAVDTQCRCDFHKISLPTHFVLLNSSAEILVGPRHVLLMDEISTGLDSATTFTVVKWMRNITHALQLNVVISLLQPAPEVICKP